MVAFTSSLSRYDINICEQGESNQRKTTTSGYACQLHLFFCTRTKLNIRNDQHETWILAHLVTSICLKSLLIATIT